MKKGPPGPFLQFGCSECNNERIDLSRFKSPSFRGALHELLARKQLAGYFKLVFGGDDFERKKPDPLPLLKTCEALGTPPAHTWMVGDSSNDARAARAAGCPVVLLSHGYNHGQPIRAVDADAVFDSLDEFLPWLRARV